MELSSDWFKLGERYGRALHIRDYASYIRDTMLMKLCELSKNMLLSIDIIPVPVGEAIRASQNTLLGVETNITNFMRKQARNSNFMAEIPYNMEQERKEAKEFLDDLQARDQNMLFVHVTLVHFADSKEELDEDTEALLSTARESLCQCSKMKFQQIDGLNTALPWGIIRVKSDPRTMTTESAAVLMPFRAQEILQTGGVYYGQNSISKNLIIADRTLLQNGNCFVFGVSGSGKSLAAKREIIAKALTTDDDILIIDPEAEYPLLIRQLGGEVIRIGPSTGYHINALDLSKDYNGGENPIGMKSDFILSLCEQFIGAGMLSAKEKSIIDRCVSKVYHGHIERGYVNEQAPTLVNFYTELERQREPEAKSIALAVELYAKGSLNTFAQPTNVDVDNRLIVYDIKDLGNHLKTVGMLVVLDAIFSRIMRNFARGRRTWVYIDEIYLQFANEYSSRFLSD